jgi:hypothetical protein
MSGFRFMQRTIFAVMLASIMTPAAAQDECWLDMKTAEMLATHRQMGGMSVSQMMEKLSSEKDPWLREMILDTFSQPLMHTPETRTIAVSEFANKWAVRCYNDGSVFPE